MCHSIYFLQTITILSWFSVGYWLHIAKEALHCLERQMGELAHQRTDITLRDDTGVAIVNEEYLKKNKTTTSTSSTLNPPLSGHIGTRGCPYLTNVHSSEHLAQNTIVLVCRSMQVQVNA